MRIFCALLFAATVSVVMRAAPPEGWPQFRGPESSGVADSSALPETWSTNGQRGLGRRRPRPRLVVADRLAQPRIRHLGDQPRCVQGAVNRHLRQRLRGRTAEAGIARRGSQPPCRSAATSSSRVRPATIRYMVYALDAADRQDCLGARAHFAASPSADAIARTPTPRRRRSPMASACTSRLAAMSALFCYLARRPPAVEARMAAAADLSRLRHGLVAGRP